MGTDLRKTAISVVGDLPWGSHFCHFYETKQDLLDSLVPYFKAGLESKEYCLWLISDPLTIEEAGNALRQAVPDLNRYLAEQSIEIFSQKEWYLERGVLDLARVIDALREKLDRALARGYPGMRLSGNPGWLGEEKGIGVLLDYEEALDQLTAGKPILMSCTYQLATNEAAAVFEIVRTHQFVGAMRLGEWEILEAPALKQTKADLKAMSEELEERVVERTRKLEETNQNLSREIAERERCELELRQARVRAESVLASVADVHVLFDRQWRCLYANKAAIAAAGLPEAQILRRTLWEIFPDIVGTDLERHYRLAMEERVASCLEFYYPATDRWWRNRFFPTQEGVAVFATDSTEQKKAVEVLQQREKELEAKSVDLEEANTALKVLLRHRDEDKTALEKAIVKNVEESIFPYIERLKTTRLDDRQAEYLNVINTNLENIVSPFLQKVAAGFARFTPMETEVAQLIRSGKTSKEIAALLGLSKRTVDTHRDGIRRKMGLLNVKTNLRTHLASLNNT